MKPGEVVRCQLTGCRGNTARWSPVLVLATLDGRTVRADTGLLVCNPCKHGVHGVADLFLSHEVEAIATGLRERGAGLVDTRAPGLDWVDVVAREAFAGEQKTRADKRILA